VFFYENITFFETLQTFRRKEQLYFDCLVFMNMSENTALHLSESMILGLLAELSSMDNPLIAQFCYILAEHPVSRASRVRSLAPSASDPTTVMDLSLDSANSPSRLDTATSDEASENSSGLVSGSEAIEHVDDANTCCRNGVKRATFGAAAKHSKAKSGKGMVTVEVDKQDSGGRGDRIAEDVQDADRRERSVVDKGDKGGGGDNNGLGEETYGSDESSDGGEYTADQSGGKRK
jgi:hypothetical protein